MSCGHGRGLGERHVLRGLRLAAALLVAFLSGCKVDNVPEGALVVALETDLSLPKDVDHVRLEWSQDGRLLHSEEHELGEGQMRLPSEFRVRYPGNDRPVLVRALASRAGELRIERSAITPVPRAFVGLLRLPLGYLCTGQVEGEESSCGPGQTCRQGECADAALSGELPRYDPERSTRVDAQRAAADGGSVDASTADGAGEGCFDVASCFASVYDVDVALDSCAFTLPSELALSRLNIALRQPLGRDGICDNGSCFVVLDADPQPEAADDVPFDGYRASDARVRLPPGVCTRIRKGEPLQVTLSLLCYSKTLEDPPCGAWSSVQMPRAQPERSPGSGDGIAVGVPGSLLGQSCGGPARRACGMCGTQGRECTDGLWGDWGSCLSEGVCAPGLSEACGRGGTRICMGDCEWGPCLSQQCEGPTSRACGNCGTQTRRCDNGVWSEWSTCSGPGVCAPNSTRSCGAGGTQVCGGSCQWGLCTSQLCVGAPAEACGNCGTRTRSCDDSTGEWSGFGSCEDEGACTPDSTRECGSGGTQSCRGDCVWDAVCSGQMCEGESSRACGDCGTQRRTCNTDTGEWSEWSACTGQGECAANATRECGSGGTQVCGGNCRWDAACTGQTCSGAALQSCGQCGVQARSCDSSTGRWSPFSACMNEGACAPGDTRPCGSGGTQSCGNDCRWQTACTDQACTGESTRACPRCGTQTRTCNSNTGRWTDWSECRDQGECSAGETTSCGNGGERKCSASCRWESACTGQSCPQPAPTRGCDRCGTQAAICDTNTGMWTSRWGECSGQRECNEGDVEACGSGGMYRCTRECRFDRTQCTGQMCRDPRPADRSCERCGRAAASCDGNTGRWEFGACMGQGACTPGQTRACGTDGGTQTCGDDCQWGSTCECKLPAPAPARCGDRCGMSTATCDRTNGRWVQGTCVEPMNACVPRTSEACAVGTRSCNDQCQWGACGCPEGQRYCTARMTCEAESAGSCGASCARCEAPGGATATCERGSCSFTCNDPATLPCNGACLNVRLSDRNNCGACGKQCSASEACTANGCVACGMGEHLCGNRCVSNFEDATCGNRCEPCAANERCEEGASCVPRGGNGGSGGAGGSGGSGGAGSSGGAGGSGGEPGTGPGGGGGSTGGIGGSGGTDGLSSAGAGGTPGDGTTGGSGGMSSGGADAGGSASSGGSGGLSLGGSGGAGGGAASEAGGSTGAGAGGPGAGGGAGAASPPIIVLN